MTASTTAGFLICRIDRLRLDDDFDEDDDEDDDIESDDDEDDDDELDEDEDDEEPETWQVAPDP